MSSYQKPKGISNRIPLPNKTRIPDQTNQRLGHYTSNASHHFHKNIGGRSNEFISHQGIHAGRYGPNTRDEIRPATASSLCARIAPP
jgi:hypothetical protein